MLLRRCLVQFIHPGPEHGPDAGSGKAWNTGDHARKFLASQGNYITDASGSPLAGNLRFWGEWEPESDVRAANDPRERDGPRWVHEPWYQTPTSYRRDGKVLQNTDPFVFGDHFLYTLCRQWKGSSPTFLRSLAAGSVILFGSLKGGEFVLDTAFVVAGSVTHTGSTWESDLKDHITDTYAQVTLRPMYEHGSRHDQFRLYWGATPNDPIEGMFSFFPTRAVSPNAPEGFARPAVSLPGLVTPSLPMGAKANWGLTPSQMELAWNSVVAQVTMRGLQLGIRAALPQRRGSAGQTAGEEVASAVGGDSVVRC